MRKRLVVANWKMHGSKPLVDEFCNGMTDQAKGFSENTEVAVCSPFVFLGQFYQYFENSRIDLGAQNLSEHQIGAYTGEISADMLIEKGCQWVLVGHSERRNYQQESSELVAQKAESALKKGLKPIICFGETMQQREAGKAEALIQQQLSPILTSSILKQSTEQWVLAYEPVWAIGTGLTATPEQAQAVHRFVREMLERALDVDIAQNMRILYGGSVKPDNAKELFKQEDIDGGLIGGAALKASDFGQICRA